MTDTETVAAINAVLRSHYSDYEAPLLDRVKWLLLDIRDQDAAIRAKNIRIDELSAELSALRTTYQGHLRALLAALEALS